MVKQFLLGNYKIKYSFNYPRKSNFIADKLGRSFTNLHDYSYALWVQRKIKKQSYMLCMGYIGELLNTTQINQIYKIMEVE